MPRRRRCAFQTVKSDVSGPRSFNGRSAGHLVGRPKTLLNLDGKLKSESNDGQTAMDL
jgi:hypothetical protein